MLLVCVWPHPSERQAWYALIAFTDVIHGAFEAALHCSVSQLMMRNAYSLRPLVCLAIRVAVCLLLCVLVCVCVWSSLM